MGGRFARPAFGECGDFFGEPICFDGVGIECVSDPLAEFVVAFVFGIGDRFEQLGVAPGAAAVFGRAASAGLDQAGG